MKNKRRTLKLLSTILCLALLVGAYSGFSANAASTIISVETDMEFYGNVEMPFSAQVVENGIHRIKTVDYNCFGQQILRTFDFDDGKFSEIFVSLWYGRYLSGNYSNRYAGMYQILSSDNNARFVTKSATIFAKTQGGYDYFDESGGPATENYNTNTVHTYEKSFLCTEALRVTGKATITTNITGVTYNNNYIQTSEDSVFY